MPQPVRASGGISGGFILLANTITIKKNLLFSFFFILKQSQRFFTLNHKRLHLQGTTLAACFCLGHLNCGLFSYKDGLQPFKGL